MTKEELQLWRDKQAGLITQEEFNAQWAALRAAPNPAPDPVQPQPRASAVAKQPQGLPLNTKILIGIGAGVIGMLAVIAFLLFWHSPEQTGKRFAKELVESAKKEGSVNSRVNLILEDLQHIRDAAGEYYYDNYRRKKDAHAPDKNLFLENNTAILNIFGKYLLLEDIVRRGEYSMATLDDGTWMLSRNMKSFPKNVRQALIPHAKKHALFKGKDLKAHYQGGENLYVRLFNLSSVRH